MRGHRRRRATQRWPATPTRPEGCGGTAGISSLLLLADGVASTRRRASTCPPSRSQQLASYFLDGTLGKGPNRACSDIFHDSPRPPLVLLEPTFATQPH